MNKKTIVISVIISMFILILLPFIVSAQENQVNIDGENFVVVVDVNIRDSYIINQDNNKIEVGFTLSNGIGAQSDIRYSARLVKEDENKKRSNVYQKIYDNKITLAENSKIDQKLIIELPDYLDGEYELWLLAENIDGLPLSSNLVGKINLKSSNNQYINISNCYLSVKGLSEKFSLGQGVDIASNEDLILSCEAESFFDTIINSNVVIDTFKRTIYGDKVLTNYEPEIITFNTKEKKKIDIIIPKPTDPQSYDIAVILKDGDKDISNTINAHYVIQGESVTVSNLQLDKTSYIKGEKITTSFLWSLSADGFLGSRKSFKEKSDNRVLYYNLSIYDNNKHECITPVKHNLLEKNILINKSINDIIINCDNPSVKFGIENESGVIILEKDYNFIPTETEEIKKPAEVNENKTLIAKEKSSNTNNIVLILIITFIILILAILGFKAKNKSINIFVFLILGSIFFGNDKVEATTLLHEIRVVGDSEWVSCEYTASSTNIVTKGIFQVTSNGCSVRICSNESKINFYMGSTSIPLATVIPTTYNYGAVWGSGASIGSDASYDTTAPSARNITAAAVIGTYKIPLKFDFDHYTGYLQTEIDYGCNLSTNICPDKFLAAVKMISTPAYCRGIASRGKCVRLRITPKSYFTYNVFADTTPPTVSYTLGTYTNNTWTNSNVTATISCSDTGGVGCNTNTYQYRESTTSFTCDSTGTWTNGTSKAYTTDGTRYICFRAKDLSGNGYSYSGVATIKIDKLVPTITDDYTYDNVWTNGVSKTITLTPVDTGLSGINTTKWCEGATCTPSTVGTGIIKNANYNNTIRYQTWDNAGNSSSGSVIVKLDNTKPIASAINASTTVRKSADISIKLSSTDTGGSLLSTAKYSWDDSNCSTGTDYLNGKTIILSTEGSHVLYLCVTDGAGNSGTWNGTYMLDKTTPTVTDILIPTFPNNLDLLATANQNFQFEVSSNGGSPITFIGVFFENDSTLNAFKTIETSNNSTWSKPENIRYVDNNRNSSGSRIYTLRVSNICDQVGHCLGDLLDTTTLKDFNYNVYANSLDIGTSSVTTNDLVSNTNIVDGTPKNMTITLKDSFGNIIIPASGISRTIGIIFNTNHNLYLNQYNNTGNAVFLNKTTDSVNYLNRIGTGNNIDTTFSGEISTDGTYNYKFKVYTPTYSADNKAYDFGLYFNNISYNIGDNIIGTTLSNINGGTFNFNYKPIYYTTISGDIRTDGFIEGAQQKNSIQVSENGSNSTFNNKLYLEFGSGTSNNINSSLNLKAGSDPGSLNLVGEGNGNSITFNNPFKNNFTTLNYPVFTNLLLQTGGILNDIQNSYFSTHIGYEINDPNGGPSTIPVVYNSDIYGKDSYWGMIGTGGIYASALKIIGQTYSTKYSEILTGQSGTDIKLVNGGLIKSSLKTEVKRNAYNIIKNIFMTSSGNTINNSDLMDNTNGIKLLSGSMIYFNGLNGDNILINNPLTFDGNKTILIEGGNLYIKGNIDVSGSKSMLSIVVLKDSNGNGGNIYINPDVKYIKAVMYADKSLISYDGIKELDGNTNFSVLKNQLYIYGSVFSENTIGGSRADPFKCPYYVTSCPDQETAQKYDLNYLRRYYLKDTDSDGIGDTPAGGSGSSYFASTSVNYKYPIIIQYNPLIQTDPSILFKK